MREVLVKVEEFKDSPVGRIPEDWDVKTLGELGTFQNGLNKGKKDFGFGTKFVNILDVYTPHINIEKLGRMNANQSEIASYQLEIGDILLDRSSVKLEGVGYPTVFEGADEPVIFCGFIIRFRLSTSTVKPRFLCEMMRDEFFRNRVFQIATRSANVNVNQEQLTKLWVTLPSVFKQEKIIEILDTVDDAIAHTSSLITKLKQIKAGLLHDLLTRGLDENGQLRDAEAHPEEFKDSVLGRIPKEWEIRTCESVCREIVVGIVIKPSQYYKPSGVPVFRSANVREAGLDPSDLVFMSEQSNRILAKSMIRTGDVLTVRTGYPGTSCVVSPDFDGANCVDIIISRPSAEINSAFLATWINSDFGKGQVLRVQGGLAQQHFNVGELQKLLIAKPSIEEQRAIQTILDTHNIRIRKEEAYLNKLKLQKQGLMHDLLTGKVRVKNTKN
ncbi:MAG: restriction endonuclease subunit S [Brasilonema angustatum HA4187-MV1]|jgi:type I restriction enzyme S subunit|nr:restriction endonuclease subunit S [Brasilonema angustatum HA4187-MV1]